MSHNRSISVNLSSNLVSYGVRLAIGILAMPICLHAYGPELYGLFLLGFGLSSSLTAFDLGAAKSVFRFTIEYHEDKDRNKYHASLNGAFSLTVTAAVVIGIFLSALGIFGTCIFNLSNEVAHLSIPIFIWAGINAGIQTLSGTPQQLLQAHHYFHQRNTWQYIPLAGQFILLLCIKPLGISLLAFAFLTTILSALSTVTDLLLVRRFQLLDQYRYRFTLAHSPASGYARQSFIHAAISFMSIQADRLIIGSILDVKAVTTYTIITKPYFLIRGLVAAGYPVFQPGLSSAFLRSDRLTYNEMSGRVIRSTFIIMMCLCGFITAFFAPMLQLWLNTNTYSAYTIWGIVSLIPICITMLYTPHYRTMAHSGYLKQILHFSMISVPVNFLISIILTRYLDFYGVIIGTLTQIIAEGIYIQWLFHRKTGMGGFNLPPKFILAALIIAIFSFFIGETTRQYTMQEPFVILLFIGFITALGSITYYMIRRERPFTLSQPNKN